MSTMTKKHFEKIASAFRNKLCPDYQQDPVRTACLEDIARSLCPVFKDLNPNFDRDRFMSACGYSLYASAADKARTNAYSYVKNGDTRPNA